MTMHCFMKKEKQRGDTIGLELMGNMMKYLCSKGYKQTSLSLQKDNYAVALYEKVGFDILKESEEEYLMVY